MNNVFKETRNALEVQLTMLKQWHQREQSEPVKAVLASRIEATDEALREIALRQNVVKMPDLIGELTELRGDLAEMPFAAGKVQSIIERLKA